MTRFLCLFLTCVTTLAAEQTFPGPEWKDVPSPLASPDAVAGGKMSVFAGQYPQSFNYYLDNNMFTAELFGAMFETLLGTDALTAESVPRLAHQWVIGDDKRTFTFHLDPDAKWSDGKPLTASDVKWTFDTIMNPTNLTGVHKVSLEVFDSPSILDERTIRFQAKEVHWKNLRAIGSFEIMPKHVFETRNFNKQNFEFPVVSGPYTLGRVKEGVSVSVVRRSDWWAIKRPSSRYVGNFDEILFRFYAERENAFEAFKKGLIDIYPVYTSRLWMKQTDGEAFAKHWIAKQKIYNQNPVGFQGYAMNMRRPPFDDVRVRKAMAHLLDRAKMNRTLMYDQYFLHRSYYEDLYSRERPCTNADYAFDKARARELLKDAGWKAAPKTGILEKDGKPFRFKFLTRDPGSDKFLAIYSEDLKDVGIELEIERKDWAAWSKDMDEFNFDMTWAAWGAGLFKDPESMWASEEADRRSGNNVTGFRNPEVDALIERQKMLFDIGKRHELCRQADHIITAQCPYVLLWNINYVRLLYWNRFGMPSTVLSKFGDERAAYWYWWHDEDSAADLADARANGDPLPAPAPVVRFDDVFAQP